ncbi:MAG: TrmH family RNA methyltransferase, partial [Chloroflexota bacterium]
MDIITSRSNPKIKQLRALRQHRGRQDSPVFLVEGIRPVGEAVEAGAHLEALYYAPEQLRSEYARRLIEQQAAAGVDCYPVSSEVFEALAEKDSPQGILAVAVRPARRLETLDPENFAWGVALVNPQDPGNLGTILRTVDAVGAG